MRLYHFYALREDEENDFSPKLFGAEIQSEFSETLLALEEEFKREFSLAKEALRSIQDELDTYKERSAQNDR